MGTLELLMLRGSSGAVYPFKVYALPADMPSAGAVFVLSRRTMENDGRGSHNPIHIGQAEDLADSLCHYQDLPCFQDYHANCICVYIDEDERDRSEIENDVLKYYSTPCEN